MSDIAPPRRTITIDDLKGFRHPAIPANPVAKDAALRVQAEHEAGRLVSVSRWLTNTFPAFEARPFRPLVKDVGRRVWAICARSNPGGKPPYRPDQVRAAVALHCSNPDYLAAFLVEGARRINLDGSDAGQPVTDEDRWIARGRLIAKKRFA